MTELLLRCMQEMLVTKDAGSLSVAVFGLHLGSIGKHWLSTGRTVCKVPGSSF